MNIVIVTSLLPFPLNSGGAQAQYNMIEYLRKRHNLALAYPQNANNSTKNLAKLKIRWPDVKFFRYSYSAQLSHLPFAYEKIVRALKLLLMPNNRSFKTERILKPYGYPLTQKFIRFVQKTINKHEANLLQVEFYPYLGLVDKVNPTIKTVFVQHEIRFVRNERMMSDLSPTLKEQNMMQEQMGEEIRLLNTYDAIVTLTDVDCHILKEHGVSSPIFVSPAGINTPISNYKDQPGNAFFIGGFGHAPNQEGILWLLQKVLPLVRNYSAKTLPEFGIIGVGWKKSWLPPTTTFKLRLYGFVDNLGTVAAGGIMLVPILSGSGMRMKILEAAALSMPIVTTSVGKEGLDFVNEVHCLVADSPQEFAYATTRLLNDATLRRKLALNAQALLRSKYSVGTLADVRQQIYNKI